MSCINKTTRTAVKNPPANLGDTGDAGLIPGLGRSPGGGHGNLFQYSCLENLHGQRVLVGYSPWGHKESDTTEQLSTHMHAPRSDTGAPYSQMCRSLLTCPAGITASRLTLLLLPLGLSPRDQQSKQSRPWGGMWASAIIWLNLWWRCPGVSATIYTPMFSSPWLFPV